MNTDSLFSVWFLGILIPVLGLFAIIVGTYLLTKRHYKVQENRSSMSFWTIFFLLISIGFVLLAFLAPYIYINVSSLKDINYDRTGVIGDTIGGLMNPFIGIAAVIVTGLAFYAQYQANKQVQDQFRLQQFESQFYKLLDFHRENVSNMEFELYKELASGNKVFKLIVNQIENAFYEILPLIENKEIKDLVVQEHLTTLNFIKKYRRSISLNQLIALDIAYTVTFLGISNRDQYALIRRLKDRYEVNLVKNVYHLLRLKLADFSFHKQFSTIAKNASSDVDFEKLKKEWQASIEDEYYMQELYRNIDYENINEYEINEVAYDSLKSRNSVKYYGGHQYRLGHYFRNLFHTFKLIDTSSFLTDSDKKNYSRIVRAQLSSYELYLLFFNSLSFFGKEWEFSSLDKMEKCIITKYEVLKNIPDISVYNQINIPNYYPDINYDFR